MRRNWNANRVGRSALLLAVVTGATGIATLPAAAMAILPDGGGMQARPAGQVRPAGSSTAGAHEQGAAVLGPAVKYVRNADGTISRVR